MAIPDEDLPRPVQSGILDPLIGAGFFSPNMSLEEIKRRRAIAGALASRARPFPKTIGEGMTYFGESVADAFADMQLGKAEKAYGAKRDADMPGAVPPVAPPVARPVADVLPEIMPPPVATAAAPVPFMAPRPSPAPVYKPTMSLAGADPLTVEPTSGPASREAIARVLAARNGTVPPGPTPPMTSPTVGAAPAGAVPDGASFAEEGGPNPPTISRDIKPMVLAQARPGGIGGVPDPLAAPQRGPVPPGGIRPTDPAASAPTRRPPEPEMVPAGKEERAWEAYRQKYINDEDVQKRAASAIAPLKQKREQDYAEARKEWELKYSNVLQEESKERERAYNLPRTNQELLDLQRKAERDQYLQSRFGTLGVEHFGKKLDESHKSVENLPASNMAIQNVKSVLPNMMSGSLAEKELALSKFLSSVSNKPLDPRIPPTEQFKAYIAPILAQMRTSIVGSGPQSEKELAKLEQAVGSDIKLEVDSIAGIVDTMEKLNLRSALSHQKKLLTFAGNDDNDRRMVMNWYGLPMEDLVPRGAIDILMRGRNNPAVREEFDREFHTPGLAERVLERKR